MSAQPDARYLAAVARQIKVLFMARKTKALRRPYKPSPRFDKQEYWVKAAETCLSLNANPETFIDAVFSQCRLREGPFPNALGGPAVRQWYAHHLSSSGIQHTVNEVTGNLEENSDEFFACLFEMAFRVLQRKIGHTQLTSASLEIMRDKLVPIHPIPRIFLSHLDPVVMQLFSEEAAKFFRESPSLIKAAEKVGFNPTGVLKI